MSLKLLVNNFGYIKNTSQCKEDFIINYNSEKSDKGYFLEVDVQYTQKLHKFHNGLPFLWERIKYKKVAKLVAHLHDKIEYVIHIRNLKQALNHGLVLTKVRRVINFNENAWQKPYINMNIDLIKKAKNDFEKDLFTLMNNTVFGKRMKNLKNIEILNLSQ